MNQESIISGTEPNQVNRFSRNLKFIVTIILFLLIIIYLIICSIVLKNEKVALSNEIKALTKQNAELSHKIADLGNNKTIDFTQDIEDIKSKIALLKDDSIGNTMSHQLTGRVVTDDFVVERAFCTVVSKSNFFIIEMDLETQPSFSRHYLGNGRFDLSDRDLKNSVNEIINESLDTVSLLCKDNGIDMTKGIISISIKNYSLASYVDGKLKLEGE